MRVVVLSLLLVFFLKGVFSQEIPGDELSSIDQLIQNYSANVCPVIFDPEHPEKNCELTCPEGYRLMGALSPDGTYVCKKESKERGEAIYCTYTVASWCSDSEKVRAYERASKDVAERIRKMVFPPSENTPLSKYLVAIATLDPRAVELTDASGLVEGSNVDPKKNTYRFFLKIYQYFIDTASDVSLIYFFMLFMWSSLVMVAGAYVQKIKMGQFSMAGHVAGEFKSIFVRGALGLLVFGLPMPVQSGSSTVYVPMVVDFARSMIYYGVEQADRLSYRINQTFVAYVTGRYVAEAENRLRTLTERAKATRDRLAYLDETLSQRGGCYDVFRVNTGNSSVPPPKGWFASATDKQLERLELADEWDSSLSNEDQFALALLCREREREVISLYYELVRLREQIAVQQAIVSAHGQGNERLYEDLMDFYEKYYRKLGWVSTAVVLPIFYASADDLLSAQGEAKGGTAKAPVQAISIPVGEFGDPKVLENVEKQQREEQERAVGEALKKDPSFIAKGLAYATLPPGNSIFGATNEVLRSGGEAVVSLITGPVASLVKKIPFIGDAIVGAVEKVTSGAIAGASVILSLVITYALMEFLLGILPFLALAVAFTLRFVFYLIDLIIFVMITPFYAVWAVTMRRYDELGNYFVRALTLAVFPVAMVSAVALGLFASELVGILSYQIPQVFMTASGDFKAQFSNGVVDTALAYTFKVAGFFMLGLLFYVAKVASAFLVFKFVFSAPEAMMEKLGQVVGGQGGVSYQLVREVKEHAGRHIAPF